MWLEHEQKLYSEYGIVYFLKKYPIFTTPFWNMKKFDDKRYAKKIDVILSGMETIGSAERSCDKDEMIETFRTISDGNYANLLYAHFGKERLDNELE